MEAKLTFLEAKWKFETINPLPVNTFTKNRRVLWSFENN
jgi:hypothetical protein